MFLLAQTSDYIRGVALFEKHDYPAAITHLLRASREQPLDAKVWKALGVSYAAQNLYQQAEPALRRACELDAKLLDACYFYARALYALDRFEPSLQVLERIAPRSWRVRLATAQALDALGKATEAELEYRAALLQSQDANPQPGTALGLFLVRQGRFAEAAAPLQAVVKRFPSAAEAHVHLGRALMEQGRIAAAIPYLERAVALDPSSAQAHLLLAKAYVRSSRTAEAQLHFEAASKGAKQ